MNMLKKNNFIYKRNHPAEYAVLFHERGAVSEMLQTDDCRIEFNEDIRMAALLMNPDDEEDYRNGLRCRFSAAEMRVYAVLLGLYEEKYMASGDFVTVTNEELRERIDGLTTEKGTKMSERTLTDAMDTLKRHGLVDRADTSYVIEPGIRFAVSPESFTPIYNARVKPWIEQNKEEGDSKWILKTTEHMS